MNKKAQKQQEDLIKDFERAEGWLAAYIAQALAAGKMGNLRDRRRASAAVKKALDVLRSLTLPKVQVLIKAGYLSGREASGAPNLPLNATDNEAIKLLAENLSGRLEDGIQTIGRRVDDIFRREGLRAAAEALAKDRPETATTDAFRNRLQRDGMTSFVDKAGRRWHLTPYTRMHIRTVTAEAENHGARNLILARDFDIVEIAHPGRYKRDPKCDDHHEKKFSLTGRSDYPVMQEEDMPPYHPFCEHYVKLAPEAVAERRRAQKRRKRKPVAA